MPVRFILGHLLGSSLSRGFGGDSFGGGLGVPARSNDMTELHNSIKTQPTQIVKFHCKKCQNLLKFNASTWLYNCANCGSSFNRGEFNSKKNDYLLDPLCPSTRGNIPQSTDGQPVELKCKNCTAPLTYDANKNVLECDYCASRYSK
jgi:uncharacterized CHY-type Zn-finger protein